MLLLLPIIALFFGERPPFVSSSISYKAVLAMDSTILHVSQVNARHIYIVNTYVTSFIVMSRPT